MTVLFQVGTGVGVGIVVVTIVVRGDVGAGVRVIFGVAAGVEGTGMPVFTGWPVMMGFTKTAITRMIAIAATPYMMSFLSIASG